MEIQQNMSFVNEGYESLGETLKSRAAKSKSLAHDFREAKRETDDMMTWLRDTKKASASWNNASAPKDSMKTQLEQQKVRNCCCRSPNGLFYIYVLNLHAVILILFRISHMTYVDDNIQGFYIFVVHTGL